MTDTRDLAALACLGVTVYLYYKNKDPQTPPPGSIPDVPLVPPSGSTTPMPWYPIPSPVLPFTPIITPSGSTPWAKLSIPNVPVLNWGTGVIPSTPLTIPNACPQSGPCYGTVDTLPDAVEKGSLQTDWLPCMKAANGSGFLSSFFMWDSMALESLCYEYKAPLTSLQYTVTGRPTDGMIFFQADNNNNSDHTISDIFEATKPRCVSRDGYPCQNEYR